MEEIIAEQFPHETRLVGCRLMGNAGPVCRGVLGTGYELGHFKPASSHQVGGVVQCSADHPDYTVLAERMLELRDIMEYNRIE